MDASAPAPGTLAPLAAAATPVPAPAPAPAASKQRPGRPPSRPPPTPLAVEGVVPRPTVEGLSLEYVHQTPDDFKRLDTVLKKHGLDDVYFRFDRGRATIAAADVSGAEESVVLGSTAAVKDPLEIVRAKVFFTIAGAKANRYFVAEPPMCWRLRRDVLEPIFHAIDKTLSRITFYAESAQPGRLVIRLDDILLEKECTYELVLPALDMAPSALPARLFAYADRVLHAGLAMNFPVRFTLTAKALAKTVADAKRNAHVEELKIVLMPGRPLEIQHFVVNVSTYSEVYRNPAKIDLKSSVPPTELFSVRGRVADLNPIASALSDSVRVYCGTGRNGLLFRVERPQEINLNVFIRSAYSDARAL